MADHDIDGDDDNKTPKTVWELYNRKARRTDKELIKDWESSINSLLLFAAIFSAVLTALCVESRKLLEEDPEEDIKQILLHIAATMHNSSQISVPLLIPFQPPKWAVIVNGFFFASLTASILAAIGAVICLQWVGEYDSGLENATTPKLRALRRHYRFRGTTYWYMKEMIASLPIALYLSLLLFFMGLVIWFFRIHQDIGILPLAGLIIWALGSTITTILSVIYPSAPFRTPISKALFRVVWLTTFSIWWGYQTFRVTVPAFIRFVRSISKKDRDFIALAKAEFLIERSTVIHQVTAQIRTKFPWIPPGQHYWLATHAYVWEQGRVNRDVTLPLSALAWLANSMDFTEKSRDDCMLILKELNQLPPENTKGWGEYAYEAPWAEIFAFVLIPPSVSVAEPEEKLKNNLGILVELLEKMFVRPKHFAKIARQLTPNLTIAFIEHLNRNRLMSKVQPLINSSVPGKMESQKIEETAKQLAIQAKARLKCLTMLLSSPQWTEMKCAQPAYPILDVILDALDVLSAVRIHLGLELSKAVRKAPRELLEWMDAAAGMFGMDIKLSDVNEAYENASTSWIFTNCPHNALNEFPNPEAAGVVANSFRSEAPRRSAISYYVKFIDAIMSGHDQEWASTMRWTCPKASPSSTQRLSMIRLLTDHIIRFQVIFDGGRHLSDHDLFQNLRHLPTRLVICAASGFKGSIKLPENGDPMWKDPEFLHAVKFWCGRRYGWTVDERKIELNPLRDGDLFVLERLFEQEDAEVKTFAQYMIGRYAQSWTPEQWITCLSRLLAVDGAVQTHWVVQELMFCLTGFHPSQTKGWAKVREEVELNRLSLSTTFWNTVWGSIYKVPPTTYSEQIGELLNYIPEYLDDYQIGGDDAHRSKLRACLLITERICHYLSIHNEQTDPEVRMNLESVKQSLESPTSKVHRSLRAPKRKNTQKENHPLNASTSTTDDDVQLLIKEMQKINDAISDLLTATFKSPCVFLVRNSVRQFGWKWGLSATVCYNKKFVPL